MNNEKKLNEVNTETVTVEISKEILEDLQELYYTFECVAFAFRFDSSPRNLVETCMRETILAHCHALMDMEELSCENEG